MEATTLAFAGTKRLTASRCSSISDRDGTFHIFRQAFEQTAPELLVGGGEQSIRPRLTPNGKQVVYVQYWQSFESSGEGSDDADFPRGRSAQNYVLEARGITNLHCAGLSSTKPICWFPRLLAHSSDLGRRTCSSPLTMKAARRGLGLQIVFLKVARKEPGTLDDECRR
jgi:hypothetical protein